MDGLMRTLNKLKPVWWWIEIVSLIFCKKSDSRERFLSLTEALICSWLMVI